MGRDLSWETRYRRLLRAVVAEVGGIQGGGAMEARERRVMLKLARRMAAHDAYERTLAAINALPVAESGEEVPDCA